MFDNSSDQTNLKQMQFPVSLSQSDFSCSFTSFHLKEYQLVQENFYLVHPFNRLNQEWANCGFLKFLIWLAELEEIIFQVSKICCNIVLFYLFFDCLRSNFHKSRNTMGRQRQ